MTSINTSRRARCFLLFFIGVTFLQFVQGDTSCKLGKPEAEQIEAAIEGKQTTKADLLNVAKCTNAPNRTCCGPIKVLETTEGVIIQAFNPSARRCGEDTIMTHWFPTEAIWSPGGRIFVYGLAMVYCFLGIAIIADKFMVAIEVITSKEKVTSMMAADGTTQEVKVLVWNETVANLTLMALGSSAPEILLAVGETVTKLGKPPEDGLGPACIVGSAAFNLLAITAICMVALDGDETRGIDDIGVFNVTAFFSVFAYVWMYFVLSDNEVHVWEAFLTVFFLFLLCGLSYGQDRSWKWCRKVKVKNREHLQKIHGENDEMSSSAYVEKVGAAREAVDLRKQLADMIASNPGSGRTKKIGDPEELAKELARREAAEKPKSNMYYRINARRGLVGGKRLAKALPIEDMDRETLLKTLHIPDEEIAEKEGRSIFEWAAPHYNVFENEERVKLRILRVGDKTKKASICYETSNGSALAGVDYEYSSGVLKFEAGEEQKVIEIVVVDDNEYEPDENFFVRLYVREEDSTVTVGSVGITEVTIINDDDPGEVGFEDGKIIVDEAVEALKLIVKRKNGSDGSIVVHYKITENTAKAGGVDFDCPLTGDLVFDHMEMAKLIPVKIVNYYGAKENRNFKVDIEIDNFPDCGARYSSFKSTIIQISPDLKLAVAVDNAAAKLQMHLESLLIGSASWTAQFSEAVTLHGEEGESPSRLDYFMHFLTFIWKVIFALVPPTTYAGGWACFCSCLMMIGALTVFVGDIAGTFGCLLGVSPTVTAITFVALGTSLPDTFASYVAAKEASNADACIGNVTGSNSVNVFLGQGLPWMIATLYYSSRGEVYQVSSGSLGFSVAVFLPCAIVCLTILYIRRFTVGFELGGKGKYPSAIAMLSLWFVYILMSYLQSEGIIAGF